ncbi:RNA-binding pno1-like [Micractinium conductrix]|uniref:RNA-binding pno1-like n=1 Tax=Micractinium conductrix TaxID=554055 RepID=A0A2P6VQ82_9CHLO|nr:RNA-binding pno1-like [Micractinium conductrix]|eukprot:PSC76230.1 RNA-binding pno1-like [Micractinium conductrix]
MPKVTKKSGAAADDLLQAAAPMTGIEAGHEDAPAAAAGDAPAKPKFAPLSSYEQNGRRIEFRRVPVPQNRMTPLKNSWLSLYKPVTENLKLDMRMNLKTRKVEVKTTPDTPDSGNLQRAADFIHAFILGFDIKDAIALLRLDDLYIECFEVKDVKTLRGEHLARCIGRMAGKNGKTKFTVENATRTRIVLADTRIHILGSFQNIRAARDSICALILGSPAGKVYSKLHSVTARLSQSY